MMPTELAMETDVKVNLEAYEAFEEMGSKGKLGDVMWKPSDEKLLTPQEAKAKWLEREVQSLKTVLNKNSLALSMVDKDEVIGLCMALCLEICLDKLGSCSLVCLCVVLCIAQRLEKNLNKLGHCMALCLGKYLNKLGL